LEAASQAAASAAADTAAGKAADTVVGTAAAGIAAEPAIVRAVAVDCSGFNHLHWNPPFRLYGFLCFA